MIGEFGGAAVTALLAMVPLAVLFLAFQVLFLHLPVKTAMRMLLGLGFAAAGLAIFLFGVAIGFLPMGLAVGRTIGAMPQVGLVAAIGLALGFLVTFGEPAVRILADQVEEASHGAIRSRIVLYTICVGVCLSTGLGLVRILYDIPLLYLLAPGYALVVAIMWLCDRDFVAIAADAGGVATGPLSNTFLLAVAIGASSVVGADSPVVSGLGLASLTAVSPMIAVMVLGLLFRRNTPQKKD